MAIHMETMMAQISKNLFCLTDCFIFLPMQKDSEKQSEDSEGGL